jgi:predicted permease
LACPAGASVIMFAQRYDRDAYYASEIFVITTLLSAVTIPLLSVVAVSLLS